MDPEHYVDRGRYSDPVDGRTGGWDEGRVRTRDRGEARGRDRGARRHPGTGGWGRAVRRLVLLGVVLLLSLLGGTGTASAHAALKGSDPADGSVLDTAPRDVTLRFTESVSLLEDSIRVVDPENRAVDTGRPGRAGGRADTARVTLPTGLGDGTYTIAWRVVSADSHPISGALIFSVGEPSATAAVLPADLTEDPLTASLYDITRYFAYGALALLIGVTFFLTVVLGGPSEVLRKLLLAGWLALLLASAVLLLLRGPYERGSGIGAALDLSVLRDTLVSRPGLALLARLGLLALAAVLLVRVRRQGERQEWGKGALVCGALLSLGLAGTWAAAEHASAGIQVPVAMTSSVLHLLAMAVWLGGLTALLTVLYRAPRTLTATVVDRFSRLAFASVVVLVVTGVYQSWRGLGSWSAFTSTAYGEVLVAKLVAVLLLLAAAAFSRRWTGRLGAAERAGAGAGAGPGESTAESRGSVGAAVPAAVTVSAAVAVPARVPERVGAAEADVSSSDSANSSSSSGAADSSGASSSSGPTDGSGPTGASAAPDDEDDAPGDMPRQALRRSVLAEFTVAVVVLVITTVLTGTLPGRAAAEIAEESAGQAAGGVTASSSVVPFDVGTPNGHGKVQIDLGPGRVGKNSVQAVVFGPDDGIATVPELRLTFTLKSQRIGPIDAKLTDRGGYWATDTLQLPLPGKWTMKLTVRTTDIDQVTVEKSVRVS
ncbi:copper resistance protein CopC/CopD [Streptomyces sp. ND05-3B]|nr:copper resistance protein CopC/CopD [Streptomyces caniscabiei]MBE4761297.1 copper resistance protein CopC/CopD [Streptomyces caniscabiei]MBE4773448.1 copper resistance protein CopC/CopD [Streptomyces caniscabiei]MBE4790105.1 copper resistance protein CopC/CopD [Streptomyces caniscabiei]MBE4799307.1 copper resistance protein CopC/CopD [Streptomyces caniscabiei]